MTCIVGYLDKKNGKTYIGADSLGSSGSFGIVRADKKVFHFNNKKDIIMGFTSSYRMGQLLMYSDNLFSELDLLKEEKIDHKYMVTKFIPKVIELYKNNDFHKKDHRGEMEGGVFIMGVKDKLFKIEGDFQVAESFDNYTACGCGQSYALSSMYTTEDTKLTPIERITKALEAAEKFSTGVQRPFYIVNTENDEVIEVN